MHDTPLHSDPLEELILMYQEDMERILFRSDNQLIEISGQELTIKEG